MRAATITIVVVLIALVLVAWQSQIGTEWIWGAPGEQDVTEAPTALEPSLPRLANSEAPTESESLTLGTSPAPATPVSNGTDATAGAVNDSTAVSLPQGADRAPAPPAPTDVNNPTPSVAIAPATTSANPPGVAHLVIRIRVSSWVEIYDRNGERLYYATGQAGDVVDVRGAEPLQVLVGFAEGVNVEYNGQPFELAPHSVRGVARFTLGQQ